MKLPGLALAIIFCAPAAFGADQLSYAPAPAWVLPVAAPNTSEAMTEAPVKVLYQNRQIHFFQNTVASFVETYARVQTPQGLTVLGNLNLPWRSDVDVLTIHKVHLLRGDQVIDVLADGQQFAVLRREDRLEDSVLDGVLTASIQPAGMEVGDILDVAFTLERTNNVLGSPDFIMSDLDLVRVDKLDLRASWEKPTVMRWAAKSAVKGIKETRKGPRTELTWSATDVGPITQPDDVPWRLRVSRRIDFTSTRSWTDLSKRLAPLFAKASTLEQDSPLLREAAVIRAAHTTPEARAGAALKLVQDRVRYVFLGISDGALVPAAAEQTWSQKFGDCKAKTALLLALLRELAIDAEPVMVNTVVGDGLDQTLPMGIVFDHVLVRARIAGQDYWLDGTRSGDTRLAFLETPNYYWGLPVRAAGSELTPMISAPLREPTADVHTRIDASKGIYALAPFTVESTLRGDLANGARNELAKLPRADQEKLLRDYWARQYSFVTPKSVSTSYDEATGAFVMKMAGDAKLGWPRGYYETDNLGLGYKVELTREDGPNKDAPYKVSHPIHTRALQEIVLPAGGKAFSIYGIDVEKTVGGIEYTRHSVIENGVFRGEARVRSVANEFPASQAKDVEREIVAMSKNTIYVEKLDDYKMTAADLDARYGSKLATADEYIDRGQALINAHEWERAMPAFENALALDPKSDRALAGRGEARFWRGDAIGATRDMNAALALNPKNSQALVILGSAANQKRDAQGALTYLDKALGLNPKSALAHGERARAYLQLAQFDKALAESAEALIQNSTWVEMFELRAQVLWRKQAWEDLEKELTRMLAKLPRNPKAQGIAASNYAALLKDEEALRAADRAVELEPSETTYLMRARVRPPSAFEARRKDIDAALKLNKDSTASLDALSRLQAQTGDHKGAAATLTVLLKQTLPSQYRAQLLSTRGVQYEKAGQTELANSDFTASLGNRAEATAFNNLCWDLATANIQLERALAECERALALEPERPTYLDSKGMALLQLKRYEEAVKAYDAAIAGAANHFMSLFGRGLAKQRLCKCADGDEDMNAARKLSPGVSRIFENYGVDASLAAAK